MVNISHFIDFLLNVKGDGDREGYLCNFDQKAVKGPSRSPKFHFPFTFFLFHPNAYACGHVHVSFKCRRYRIYSIGTLRKDNENADVNPRGLGRTVAVAVDVVGHFILTVRNAKNSGNSVISSPLQFLEP